MATIIVPSTPRPSAGAPLLGFETMEDALKVEYLEGEIFVTRPGTAFSARYHKPDRDPILRLLAATVDPNADREAIFIFRAQAFAAATNKARELGWVV